jgi:hypothetical protein
MKESDVITNMVKLLELQQKRELVAVDMIAAAIAVEREACAKIADIAEPYKCADLIRARGKA